MNVKETLHMLAQEKWVCAGAKDSPEISEMLMRCAETCHRLNAMSPSDADSRQMLMKGLFGSFGRDCVINSPFRCDFGFNIHIGDNFVGNFNLSVLDEAEVRIGRNVMIGPNCTLTTIVHALDAGQRNRGVMRARPINIGDNVWIASNVVVLPGVTIGDNAVIGAGSVVTADIPSDTLAFGTPCRPVRRITEADRLPL